MRHHARVFSAAILLALAIFVTAPTGAQAQTTVLFLDSETGDYVGRGLRP